MNQTDNTKTIGNFFFPDMRVRSEEPELMDDPGCDEKKLLKTVEQFTYLNYLFTASRQLIKRYILKDILKKNLKKVSFLDIGAGGCDLPLWFLRVCKKKKIEATVTCIDNDQKIVTYAQEICADEPKIKIIRGNAFKLDEYGSFDYIFANHFLHHIADDALPGLLQKIAQATNELFLLNDLRRSSLAYLGYTLFTGLFVHNSFAFYDGRLSIRRGFTKKELQAHISAAGIQHYVTVAAAIPARLCLVGQKQVIKI